MQQLSVRLLESFEADTGVDPEFRRIGYLFVLTSDSEVDEFRRMLPMWHHEGVSDARWVEARELRELAPMVAGDDILGGTFCPSDGIASPHAVTSGYANSARASGVTFLEGVAVTGIEHNNGGVQLVRTTAGDIVTSAVFNCAGAWAGEVGRMAGIIVPVEPYPRNIFVTDPMPALRNGAARRETELQHRGRLDHARSDGRSRRASSAKARGGRHPNRMGRPVRGDPRPSTHTGSGR
jgi:sarcosine oxidase subunit beta